jgi:sugar (pentulose or hexulose) kinase
VGFTRSRRQPTTVRDLLIGIDVGTTTIKSAAFALDEPREPILVARRPARHAEPEPGWSEVDPRLVEEAAFATVRELVAELDPGRVAAVAISGTACGAWLADERFEPVRPAILWNDGRAAEITGAWRDAGLMDRIFAISGNVPFPGYTLSVLAWLARHEPESLARAARVLWCKDWLRGKLTGILATDETEASYVPFDIVRRAWSDELVEIAGLSRWRHLFPDFLPPQATAPLTREGASFTGLLAGTPVAVGATDIIAGVVGAGAVRVGGNVTILGTSANSTVVSAEPLFEPWGVGIMARSPLDRYARSLINTSGSATLDWGARLLTGGDVGAFLELAARAPAGALGLSFVPYLSPAGSVSPRLDPLARGTFGGLRAYHERSHVARAIVEGLAAAVADCYAHMAQPVEEIVVIGGAARSDLLLQALADLSDRPVVRLSGDEFGARGVAVLAGWAIGAISDLEYASGALDPSRRFDPQPDSPLRGALEAYQDLAARTAGWIRA